MSASSKIELIITSNAQSLPIVRSAVERMARLEGFGDADVYRLILAIDEALANVIKHGYEGQPDKPIAISLCAVTSGDGRPGLQVQVRDKGRQVDPTTIQGRCLDDIRPGGLGVHIIRAVMDEYDYSCPAEGGMLLRMTKYVSAADPEPGAEDAGSKDPDPRRLAE